MTPAAERLTAKVVGRVQGVGYRFFTVKTGRGLRLTGYARNCPDGSVEVVAEGARARLMQLLGALRRGPSGSQVDHVHSEFETATGEFAGFDVRY
jgi:acylphosphatase